MHSAANSRNSVEGSQPSKVGSLFSFDIANARRQNKIPPGIEIIRMICCGLLIRANKLIVWANDHPRSFEPHLYRANFAADPIGLSCALLLLLPNGLSGRKAMEWFKQKTSIAGAQVSNWMIVRRDHHSLAHL